MVAISRTDPYRLNGICPYFTMFPLEFPLSVLRERAQSGEWVIDPFCGRGTTNFAGRALGLSTYGIDSSPVAVASSQAKLVSAAPMSVKRVTTRILSTAPEPTAVPQGRFWERAFAPQVLRDLCKLRESLLASCESEARIALRGLLLGALHGPKKKDGTSTYLSNQCPRTYAPKPAYSVKYWQTHGQSPPELAVADIIALRAERYYGVSMDTSAGRVVQADSRERQAFRWCARQARASWVITSPPYYGMRTYIPDQWLRNWFVGGPAEVDYTAKRQISHRSPDEFAAQLRKVWSNVGEMCHDGATMVIRFGGINDRKADPRTIILNSLNDSTWRLDKIQPAGTAANGKRQADHFLHAESRALEEFDVWVTKQDTNIL